MDFELIPRNGAQIEVVTELPSVYAPDQLMGGSGIMAKADFGNFLFWHYPGDGYAIWKNVYDIKRDGSVTGLIKKSILELSIMYENSFAIEWKDIIKGKLDHGKIEMYGAPGAENTALFKGGMRFSTIDFHFQSYFLEAYAKHFPLLDAFLAKVSTGSPVKLFNTQQFISPRMETAVREMLQYRFTDELAPRYYDSYVHIIIILLLEQLAGFTPGTRRFSAYDIEVAVEAKRLLSLERGYAHTDNYTIPRLCRLLSTNPYKLKTSFLYCFGMTIGKYKKKMLMKQARSLLESGVNKLDEVAMILGYASPKSFGTAFKSFFKYPPGAVMKKK
ncbi:MAG: AraC family transcriptional regulator [Chitinophagaceae bacterium]